MSTLQPPQTPNAAPRTPMSLATPTAMPTKLQKRLSQQLEASRDEKWRKSELEAGAHVVAKLFAERGRSIYPADMEMAATASGASRIQQDLLISGVLSVWIGSWRERKWCQRMCVLTPRALYMFKPNAERASRFGPNQGAPAGTVELSKELFGELRSCTHIDESTVIFEMFAPSLTSSNSTPISSASTSSSSLINAAKPSLDGRTPNFPTPLPIFQISRPGKTRILCRAPTMSQAIAWVKTLRGVILSHKRALADALSIHYLAEQSSASGLLLKAPESGPSEIVPTPSSPTLMHQLSSSSALASQNSGASSENEPSSYERFHHSTSFYTLPSAQHFGHCSSQIPTWAAVASLRSIHMANMVATPVCIRGDTNWDAVASLAPTPSFALLPPSLLFNTEKIKISLSSSITTAAKGSPASNATKDLAPSKLAYALGSSPFGRSISVPLAGLPEFLRNFSSLYSLALSQGNEVRSNMPANSDLLGDQLGLTKLLLSAAFCPSSATNEMQVMFEGIPATVRINLAPLVIAILLSRRVVRSAGSRTSCAMQASFPISGWSGEADLHLAFDIENDDDLPYGSLDPTLSNAQTPFAFSTPIPTRDSPRHQDGIVSRRSSGTSVNSCPVTPSICLNAYVNPILPKELGERVIKLLKPRLWLSRLNFISIVFTLTEYFGLFVFFFADSTTDDFISFKDGTSKKRGLLRRCIDGLLLTSMGRLGLGFFTSAGTSLAQCFLIQDSLSRKLKRKSNESTLARDSSENPNQEQDLINFAEDIWTRELEGTEKRLFALMINGVIIILYAVFILTYSSSATVTSEGSATASFTNMITENGGFNRFTFDCIMLPFVLFFFARGFNVSRAALQAINTTCMETTKHLKTHPYTNSSPLDANSKSEGTSASEKDNEAFDFKRSVQYALMQSDEQGKDVAMPRLKMTFIRTVDAKSGSVLSGSPFLPYSSQTLSKVSFPSNEEVANHVAQIERSEAAVFLYQCDLKQREARQLSKLYPDAISRARSYEPISEPETKGVAESDHHVVDEIPDESNLWLKLASLDPCSRVFEQSDGRASALIRPDGVPMACANQLLATTLAVASTQDVFVQTAQSMVEVESSLLRTNCPGVLSSVTAASVSSLDNDTAANREEELSIVDEGDDDEEDDEGTETGEDGVRPRAKFSAWDVSEPAFQEYINSRSSADSRINTLSQDNLPASTPLKSPLPRASSSERLKLSLTQLEDSPSGAGTTITEEHPVLGPFHQTAWGKWCQADWRGLKLRGPEYLTKRIKIPALQHRFDACFCEIWACKKALKNVGSCKNSYFNQQKERAERMGRGAEWANGTCLKYMIVNMLVPGSPQYNFIMYFRNPEYFNVKSPGVISSEAAKRSKDPFVRLMQNFVDGNDTYRTAHFKYIPNVVVGGWVLKRSVGNTPVILGNKLAQSYFTDDAKQYIEIDVDVSSSTIAGSVLGVVKGSAKKLEIELNFLLEPHKEDELPEALWGGVRIMNVDLDGCVQLPLVP